MTEIPNAFLLGGNVPPGFDGAPILYMMTIFSLLLVNLLALEWSWRLVWSMVEKPMPFKHPEAVMRWILFMLVLGAIIRSGPDVLWLTMWDELDVSGRERLLRFDDYMDSIAFIPWTLAWFFSWIGGPMINYQLRRNPVPVHLWPTAEQFNRPAKIIFSALIIAAAITFLK